jgi:hypothetical protein
MGAVDMQAQHETAQPVDKQALLNAGIHQRTYQGKCDTFLVTPPVAQRADSN